MRYVAINLLLATIFLVLGATQLREGQLGWALVDLVMCLIGLRLAAEAWRYR